MKPCSMGFDISLLRSKSEVFSEIIKQELKALVESH